jgi:hypothetical protein
MYFLFLFKLNQFKLFDTTIINFYLLYLHEILINSTPK